MDDLDPKASPADLLSAAVEANVRYTVRELLATPEAKARLGEVVMRLVGAVYEFDTGRVRFRD